MANGKTNNKVKKLKDIKNAENAHPYSRKANQMRRAVFREHKMTNQKEKREHEKDFKTERLLFFKSLVSKETHTLEDHHDFIQMYIDRFSAEIKELVDTHRAGRPKSAALSKYQMIKEGDEQEYKNGFEMPDMTETLNIWILKEWTGDYNGISRIKMIKFEKIE